MIKRGGGSIIFTSSFVGYTAGMPGMAAYAASTARLIGLTQVLAAELGEQGIRVNAILPGGTDTAASITNAPAQLRRRWRSSKGCMLLNAWQPRMRLPVPYSILPRTRQALRPAARFWLTG